MSNEVKETNFQITGMTCAACATRIEKGLKKMEGVKEANVNLALEKSTIKYDPEVVSEQDFQKKIQSLGYDVVKEKVEFDITGMTCAACANKIEKRLNKFDGV
jgi:Cu+-exporting ATPase